jgi:hypothetical protein
VKNIQKAILQNWKSYVFSNFKTPDKRNEEFSYNWHVHLGEVCPSPELFVMDEAQHFSHC